MRIDPETFNWEGRHTCDKIDDGLIASRPPATKTSW